MSAVGHVIGADVGSQSVKTVLCNPEGKTLATASHPCTMQHSHSGWSEQDPAEWRGALAAAVREVLAKADLPGRAVGHLGLACQVDGVVPLDRELRPLRPAIIWLDRRSIAEAQRMVERLGADRIFDLTGCNPDASHIAPKMMWLRRAEPAIYRSTRLLAPVAGYLLGWLTGRALQDHANASSTLLYDVIARKWAEPLLEASGVDPDLLVPIAPSHQLAGRLRPEIAEILGLTEGCEAVVGTGDDHAAALGAGVVAPGALVDVTGTAEPVAAVPPEAVLDPERLVETHAHAMDDTLLIENPGFVSGGSTLWLAGLLGGAQETVFARAADAPAGADGVIFLPALSGATTPHWNDRMRGAFQGLSMNHDPSHLSRAVLEGCAYALRDVTDRMAALGLGGEEIRVVGGGGRSPLWVQIKADVCGMPVRQVLGEEPTAIGAAMLAAVGAGTFADTAEAAASMTNLARYAHQPNPATNEVYEESYHRYRAVFDAIAEVTT